MKDDRLKRLGALADLGESFGGAAMMDVYRVADEGAASGQEALA